MKFDAKCMHYFIVKQVSQSTGKLFKKKRKDRTSIKIHYNFSNCLKNILLVSSDAEFYANYFVFERQNRGIDTFTVKCKKVKKCSKI